MTLDTPEQRKVRGAFFTPYPIAEFLAGWALRGAGPEPTILDPTCGDGVFLLAAETEAASDQTPHLLGMDIHGPSLDAAKGILRHPRSATMLQGDFFSEPTPDQLGARLPYVDALVGNPPFVRYQGSSGSDRRLAARRALAQGVRLSGLSSSWAPLLVHASGFLKPDGRLAMVVPAELLSVGYAEPIRRWLKQRFASVHLVLFDRLQFSDAEEQVVLLVARGSGGCHAFTLHHVSDAADLARLHIFDSQAFAPEDGEKWTDLLVPEDAREMLRRARSTGFAPLSSLASVELGTVTGANKFFTLSEAERRKYGLIPGRHVVPTVPPGVKNVTGLRFTRGRWEQLRLEGERVWMLSPAPRAASSTALTSYIAFGEQQRFQDGYKCSIRDPWWRLEAQPAPSHFLTYMSNETPRVVLNDANATIVNSLHGVRLLDANDVVSRALPYVFQNTVTLLAAELEGRAYGGGILKLEPREGAGLPVPAAESIEAVWGELKSRSNLLEEFARLRRWADVTTIVDEALLLGSGGLSRADLATLAKALREVRNRRMRREVRDEG